MATTTGGTTYVTSTDLVANYPTASLALANRVDVVASGGPVLVKTGAYTLTVADILSGNKFLYNSASPGTFTFPTASLVDGMVIQVAQIGSGALTVTGGTIVGTTVTTAQYQSLTYVYVATGTTWYSVAPPSTAPGLTLITSQTFTTASTVNVNNCFSATYTNYRIMIFTTNNTTNTNLGFRWRAAGADRTGSVYNNAVQRFQSNNSTVGDAANESANIAILTGGLISTVPHALALDAWTPYIGTTRSGLTLNGKMESYATAFCNSITGAVSYAANDVNDGFTLIPGAGTMTGVVKVYGYRD
jgi:hypothetical protein